MVSEKMIPLFGSPENCGPVWVKEPIRLPPLARNWGTLGKGFCFLASYGACDVECCRYCLNASKILISMTTI